MDLFKLLGTISINNTEANEALDETSKAGEKAESKLGKAFSSVGKGAVVCAKAVGGAMIAGGTAVGAFVTQSVQSFADYEQLVGGIETLFAESASKVEAYADVAYKTAGLSANEYMETVTGFSASLLQSLGGDTEMAAEKADMAIRDMSDNANKMGTDMASIQTTYQGFAKQNYTMLDNLKLGYGGTQEEMKRLLKDAQAISGVKYDISSYADVIDAIHVIQTEMGITGTTAKEASTTISGSIASMKGSWQNLLTAMSGDGADLPTYINNFVDSVKTVAGNLIPVISVALDGVVQLIAQLAPMIGEAIPGVIASVLPTLVSAATNLVDVIVQALPQILDGILAAVPQIMDGILTLCSSLLTALPEVFGLIVGALPGLIEQIASAIPVLLPQLISALVQMIVMLCEIFPQVIQPIIDNLPDIIMSIADAIVDNLPVLLDGLITLVLAIVEALPQIMKVFIAATPTVIEMLVTALLTCLPQLLAGLGQIIWAIVQALPTLLTGQFQQMIGLLVGVWNAVKTVFAPAVSWFGEKFRLAKEKVCEVFAPVGEFFSGIWDGIKQTFAPVVHFFSVMFENAWITIQAIWSVVDKFFEIIWALICAIFEPVAEWFSEKFQKALDFVKEIWEGAKQFFTDIWDGVKNIFKPVDTWFKEKFQKAKEAVKGAFSGIKTYFSDLWQDIKDVFGDLGTVVGDSVGGAVKSAINAIITTAENSINGFFKLINSAITAINKIPNVNISKLKMISFTKLAKGGVVDKATPAIFGEDGAEAVVPLENNTGWLNKIASKLHEFSLQYDNGLGDISIRSVELQQAQVSELQMLNVTTNKILTAILTMDENMGGHLREALDGVSFDVNKREFARLVKGTI